MRSFSTSALRLVIVFFNSSEVLFKIDAAITGRDTPQALPNNLCDSTNTYGTFLSSHNKGKCKTISNGLTSAAITIKSLIPLLRVLVDSFAPFFIFFNWLAFVITLNISFWILFEA